MLGYFAVFSLTLRNEPELRSLRRPVRRSRCFARTVADMVASRAAAAAVRRLPVDTARFRIAWIGTSGLLVAAAMANGTLDELPRRGGDSELLLVENDSCG